jgi:D-alanyl-D-alanine carboxypeptidase/D-alanyl-D-alanine-endopeptidase (penicillin-binding protein 4)
MAREAVEVVAPIFAEAGPGTRWGMVVADDQGREIVAIDPEGRFMPASNTKVFTTAAALWAEARGQGPDLAASGASVRMEGANVILAGRGDARLSGAAGCLSDCLTVLADAVAAKTRKVGAMIGDATLWPDQRWSPGMSWNNIPFSYGTATSALTLDDNEIAATVSPGKVGEPPVVAMPEYYTVEMHARTVPGAADTLGFDRMPGSRVIVVTGTLGAAHDPISWSMAVDDPAHYAAWRLAEMLRARGVTVTGEIASRYRPLLPSDDPAQRTAPPARAPEPPVLAQLTPGPLAEDVRTILKVSQNLHAELLLRRTGLAAGTGSIADGQAVVGMMLAEAGVAPGEVSLSDGSGMSSYNRVAPRGMVRLLNWIAAQPWGAAWRDALPIGGVDGTLRRRFANTMLAGKVRAKTGTLNATYALSGWLTAASGKVLTFSIYANDVPDGVAATALMDRALLALAAAN